MLFSNTGLESKIKTLPFGDISLITLGECGRGRKEIFLYCNENDIILDHELMTKTIIPTKKGNGFRMIDNDKSLELFLLLHSDGGYTRRGNGRIYSKFECLAEGNGADGEAGRIGDYECKLIKSDMNNGVKAIIKYSGAEQKKTVILVYNNKVMELSELEYNEFLMVTNDINFNDFETEQTEHFCNIKINY